jgi:hypothetical protein
MSCTPLNDSAFSVPPSPGTRPSFQLPNLNIPIPSIPLDDLSELFQLLSMILPPGTLKPTFEPDVLNDIYAGIKNLLDQFLPFLMLYKFLLPILDMILCIIEVLCSLTNPIKMIRALKRLFRVCIPEFLSLFPFLALILMIISLLLLLLALIEYLIQRILQIIEMILKNLIILAKSTQALNNDSIIAIVKKIGDLLCVLQNLFILFAIFNLIIQVIKAILSLAFKIPPCDSSDGSADGCCTPDVCPDFLKNNTTITSNTGTFLYYGEVGLDSGLTLPMGFPPIVSVIRQESWQFYDPNLSQSQAFINIVMAHDFPPNTPNIVFFPPGTAYTTTTSPFSTPYIISFEVFYNPAAFGVSDPKGPRNIKIKNAIVVAPPTIGTASFDGHSFVAPFNGTLNLIGGNITEDNDQAILDANGFPLSLNAFFHQPINFHGEVPLITDGVAFSNISYTFTINHDILAGASLITLGCIPDVAVDRDFINTTLGAQFNINGQNLANVANLLPDMTAAQQCVTTAITNYRQSISTATTNAFQTEILTCLNNLRASTVNALTAAITSGFDQYKSDFTLDPNIQFVTKPIIVSVSLNEGSGTAMTNNLPADAAATIANQITANISFGDITTFTYDGSQLFLADLTSTIPGNGTIKVAFDNNFISTLNNPTNIDQSPSVAIKVLDYTFVQSPVLESGQPRRDEGDVSRENS